MHDKIINWNSSLYICTLYLNNKQLTAEKQELRAELDHVKLRNAQLAGDHNKFTERLIRLEYHSRETT